MVAARTMAIGIYAFAAFLGALGQLLFKLGAHGKTAPLEYAADWRVLVGAALYLIILVLFLAGLRTGTPLSILYPVYALTFVFGAVLGAVVLDEPLRVARVAGLGVIVIGVWLAAR